MKRVKKSDADLAWFLYDLEECASGQKAGSRLTLVKKDEVYTKFGESLLTITTPKPGKMENFIHLLQDKLDEQLESSPDNFTIERPF